MQFLPVLNDTPSPIDSPANDLSESLADIVPDPVQMAEIRPKILEVLATVFDPEIPVNIYELGLIYKIEAPNLEDIKIKMTLTSPMCPVAESLPVEVEQKIRAIPDVKIAQVDLTWDPPWNPQMMSEAAKLQLNLP
jgi:FeS assembly SUF system protein